jgi:hypothetical protein
MFRAVMEGLVDLAVAVEVAARERYTVTEGTEPLEETGLLVGTELLVEI